MDQLRKFSRGDLAPKQFLSVYKDAGELLDLLYEHLQPRELVVSVHDWPTPRRKPSGRQYVALKTMLLITPLVLIGGSVFVFKGYALASMITVAVWFAVFAFIALSQLLGKFRVERSREGKSVLVITNVRLMRVWLDGTEEVQSWSLKEDKSEEEAMEPVSPTIRLLLEIDQGKISLN